MKTLPKSNLDALLTQLSQSALVYVPKEVSGVLKFAPDVSSDPMRLDATNTLLPPKDLLFPQCQKMYHYGVNNDNEMYSPYVTRMLDAMEYDVPYSAKQIMEKLHLRSKETFRKNYMNPALKDGIVKMTIPDRPRSKNQRYFKK